MAEGPADSYGRGHGSVITAHEPGPQGPQSVSSLLPSRRLSEGSGAAHPVVVARSPITQKAGGSGGSLLHVSVSMSARLRAMEALALRPVFGREV